MAFTFYRRETLHHECKPNKPTGTCNETSFFYKAADTDRSHDSGTLYPGSAFDPASAQPGSAFSYKLCTFSFALYFRHHKQFYLLSGVSAPGSRRRSGIFRLFRRRCQATRPHRRISVRLPLPDPDHRYHHAEMEKQPADRFRRYGFRPSGLLLFRHGMARLPDPYQFRCLPVLRSRFVHPRRSSQNAPGHPDRTGTPETAGTLSELKKV